LQFLGSLKDNLNAEVALGTVTNVKEACAWLGYTYLFIRMKTNPLVYGIAWEEVSFFSIIQIFDVFKDIRVT
jgi:activating signal cointegrator complex subunit 3